MNNYPSNLSDSIINWFKSVKIMPENLYCRECGVALITENLTDVHYTGKADQSGYAKFRRIDKNKSSATNIVYMSGVVLGDDNSRWVLRGRLLSGTLFFRHTCWKCYIKKLFATVDVAKKAKKSSYYRKLFTKGYAVPATYTSPNHTFKYLFDIDDATLANEHLKFDTASKNAWIRRHGAAGESLFKTYQKRQGYTASTNYLIAEKGFTEAEAKTFHNNRAATRDNFVKRYGEDVGGKKWIAYCDRQAYAGNKREYFVEKFGTTVGNAQYNDICHQKGITLQNFIRKYGELIGRQKWLDRCEHVNIGYSKIATELFLSILLAVPKENKPMCKFAEYGKETFVTVDNKTYFIDFTYGGKAIEFFGDYWHANPDIYIAEDIILPSTHTTAAKQWKKDNDRLQVLKALGYDVLVIWESDYRTNPNETVNKCLTFLSV